MTDDTDEPVESVDPGAKTPESIPDIDEEAPDAE